MAHDRLRTFNKHITNRLTRHLARCSWGPIALVRHFGRRSGTAYETPIMVERAGDGFLIALTYGPGVDWYRNVLAAGHCTLLWHGRKYALSKPEPLAVQTALQQLPQPQRLILRLLGTQHFVRMKAERIAGTPGA
jgi:deazaflavin-dependent oxidoreductase (nitroreductase family)